MLKTPCLLPQVVEAVDCAEWLRILDAGFTSANGASLRLANLRDIDLDRAWQALARSGVLQHCEQALGAPLACNLDQSWARRQHPPGDLPAPQLPHGWHQDGALHFDFIVHERGRDAFSPDALLKLVTCWIALTPCGIDAPSLELITERPDALTPASQLTDIHLRERFDQRSFWRPALEPGDALLFGGDALHRTHVTPSMTRPRTSLEFRFFAADAIPARVRDERFTRLAATRATPR